MSSAFLPPSLTSLFERNQEATVYVGNVDLRVSDENLWELFIQCGQVTNVAIPRDKITGEHQGFGFVEFRSEEEADYAIKIMHMIKLYGKPIKVNKATQDKKSLEVGANIFVGNLSDDIDEKTLKDVFSAFGVVLSTKIMRDVESGFSKNYGFVSFDNFESSDAAINTMNGQFLGGKQVDVSYAYKKDSKGEKHGSVAERVIAANKPVGSGSVWMNNLVGSSPALTNPLNNSSTQASNKGGLPGVQGLQNVPGLGLTGLPGFPTQGGYSGFGGIPGYNDIPGMQIAGFGMQMPGLGMQVPGFGMQMPNLPISLPNMNDFSKSNKTYN